MSNPYKNWLVQKQTDLGKVKSNPLMADNLPKIVWYSTHHIPLMKSWLVQKQTALGKDKSNPLMADNLPKIVWYSTHHIPLMKSWLVQKQMALVQKQMALGKDKLNSLMAENLPKIVWYSTHHIPLMKSWLVQKQTALGQTTTGKEILNPFMAVVITEATIRDTLCLDDAEGVDCLPNEEIFAKLARMGYEKPSTKLTFNKPFFSSQWKFLIHTILQSLSAKCTSWNEFSSTMASAVICLSTDDVDDAAAQGADTVGKGDDVHETSIPSPTPPTLPPKKISGSSIHISRADTVGKGDDVHETSIPSPTLPTLPPKNLRIFHPHLNLLQEALDACATLAGRVEHIEYDKVAQALEITKLKRRRIKSSDDTDMEDTSNQGRMIDELDKDEVTAASTTIVAAEPQVPAATIITALVRVDVASTRRRKRVVIRDPEEESTVIIPADTKSKDKGKGIMIEEPKPMKKKQQVEMDEEYAKKLHEDLNKDIDWDVAIDHVKQKAKEDPINETPAQKAAKRRKLNEEVEDLKQHLEIVPDEDDDVYTEATPLARKVLVVDYEIIHFNNKLHYKIIRADGTHQLYVSFITLLKNFDKEDLQSLWSLVKERFFTSKPNNFSDDYLLTTLGAMFERPDGQAQVWKNQRTVHGQARVKS
nr:hypothetical protein [Tanacetum cinerariifolium]